MLSSTRWLLRSAKPFIPFISTAISLYVDYLNLRPYSFISWIFTVISSMMAVHSYIREELHEQLKDVEALIQIVREKGLFLELFNSLKARIMSHCGDENIIYWINNLNEELIFDDLKECKNENITIKWLSINENGDVLVPIDEKLRNNNPPLSIFLPNKIIVATTESIDFINQAVREIPDEKVWTELAQSLLFYPIHNCAYDAYEAMKERQLFISNLTYTLKADNVFKGEVKYEINEGERERLINEIKKSRFMFASQVKILEVYVPDPEAFKNIDKIKVGNIEKNELRITWKLKYNLPLEINKDGKAIKRLQDFYEYVIVSLTKHATITFKVGNNGRIQIDHKSLPPRFHMLGKVEKLESADNGFKVTIKDAVPGDLIIVRFHPLM